MLDTPGREALECAGRERRRAVWAARRLSCSRLNRLLAVTWGLVGVAAEGGGEEAVGLEDLGLGGGAGEAGGGGGGGGEDGLEVGGDVVGGGGVEADDVEEGAVERGGEVGVDGHGGVDGRGGGEGGRGEGVGGLAAVDLIEGQDAVVVAAELVLGAGRGAGDAVGVDGGGAVGLGDEGADGVGEDRVGVVEGGVDALVFFQGAAGVGLGGQVADAGAGGDGGDAAAEGQQEGVAGAGAGLGDEGVDGAGAAADFVPVGGLAEVDVLELEQGQAAGGVGAAAGGGAGGV